MMRSSPIQHDSYYPKRLIRFEKYPLPVLRTVALARQRHHAKKMGILNEQWYRKIIAKMEYRSVSKN